jgi:hypothetical protein
MSHIYAMCGFHTQRTLREGNLIKTDNKKTTTGELWGRGAAKILGCIPVLGVVPIAVLGRKDIYKMEMQGVVEQRKASSKVATFHIIRSVICFFGGGIIFLLVDFVVTSHRFGPCSKSQDDNHALESKVEEEQK